jgi:integrase/recombinase XerC
MVVGQMADTTPPAAGTPSLPVATAASPAPVLNPDRQERLKQLWHEAEEAWLGAKGANSRNTRRAYATALRMFKEHCRQNGDSQMWSVGGAELMNWQEAMRDAGLAETTINLRLSALSSFFEFVCQKYSVPDPRTGRAQFLRKTNPVRHVERAKVIPYEEADALSLDEVRALLQSIPQRSAYDFRDRALIITYLYTGRRSSEVRKLRWGDITHDRGRVYYRWSGKGKSRTDELPLPAYNAIVDYLDAAGLLAGIQDDDYIFAALSDAAANFNHVDEAPENQPLGSDFINRIVKKRARRAGLKWERIHTHTLRHTAAMLRSELTDDLKAIQHFLNHSTSATTDRYLRGMRRQTDTLWTQVEALIDVE